MQALSEAWAVLQYNFVNDFDWNYSRMDHDVRNICAKIHR